MNQSEPNEEALCFGSMRLFRASRLLIDGEQAVRLGGRAFDLLVVLVENAGQVLSKNTLVARVWPRTVVEETSLRVHIGALRKLLRDGQGGVRYIVNVPGRGYSFIAPVQLAGASAAANVGAETVQHDRRQPLPARLTRMIGRGSETEATVQLLDERRFVTLVGPGGIGKTTLALAVAERVAPGLHDGAVFVDLAALADDELLVNAIGAALGVSVLADAAMECLTAHLHDKRMLLILDNCEHVLARSAQVAMLLLKAAPDLRILVTSREPLCADGENVRRLTSLETPPALAGLSAAEALQYPAVQLLVERVMSSMDGYELGDGDANAASELCRRLDGNPLAIELAAVRVGFFGLKELLARLDDRLRILSDGHRTVLPRHQTLRALYDWSHALLPEAGRIALRRLAVFPGVFTLEDAIAVAASASDQPLEVEDAVIDLVAKSLVSTDPGGETMRYRLLYTTRAYAAEQLAASGEAAAAHRRHAEHLVSLLARANPEWDRASRSLWLLRYGYLIDDVRAALDWACQQGNDALLGASLTQVAFQLAQQMSLFEEFREKIERALDGLARAGISSPLLEMELNVALSSVLGQINPPGVRHDDVTRPIVRATQVTQALRQGTVNSQISYAQWVSSFGHGDYPAALSAARQMEDVSRSEGDPEGALIGQRMLAQTWHFLGDHALARHHADTVLRSSARALRVGGKMLDPVDRRVSMRIVLARVCWIEGDLASAERLTDEALVLAEADMAYVQCQVLAMAACPLAIWNGHTARAEAFIEQLQSVSQRHVLGYWSTWGQAFNMVMQGNLDLGLCEPGVKLLDMLGTMGARVVDASMLQRCESGQVGWCAPEILRAHAEAILCGPRPQTDTAEHYLMRALMLARTQHAASWELRAALSLCRLRLAQRRDAESLPILAAACGRFAPDQRGAELDGARQLLTDLCSQGCATDGRSTA